MSDQKLCFSFILICTFLLVFPVLSIPEQGMFELAFFKSKTGPEQVVRTMFKDSYFIVKIQCPETVMMLTVQIEVDKVVCANVEVGDVSTNTENARQRLMSYTKDISCHKSESIYLTCDDCSQIMLGNQTEEKNRTKPIPENAAVVIPEDGIYTLAMFVNSFDPGVAVETKFADITVEAHASSGYLSASDWPQLPFFRVMFVVYFFYTLLWLVLCCCHRADLLRIQYWVAGVIFIGLIEKAVFLGEYETLNKTGQSVNGAIIFGELVSSAKKMLSRMLVIIVSVGFGIVKPRLGTTLHKVLAVGLVYFIASAIEGCLRGTKARIDRDRMMSVAELVLAIIDSVICWWIFSSLVQTMRTLRLRRNVVKLSLYRHFTNTLIFAVLASVGFMIWSTIEHKFAKCLRDWRELWVDEAFWHLLFAILLLVIMILWRPSANNQRYAYSPLTDAADEDAEEPMINEAFDGIKMRNTKTSENNSSKSETQMDEDLKWIEDNIPASVVDSALPSLLDSEEEVVTTAYEMNKMQ